MREIKQVIAALALVLAAVAGSPPVGAQPGRDVDRSVALNSAPPSAFPGVFGEVLDVRVINLEVVVTDKQGTQIRGLGAGDFQLMIDGVEVPIEYFSEIRSGLALETPASSDADSLPAELLPGVPSLTPGEPVGTSYLVFVDDFFSLKGDRNAVLASLKEDLPYLKPEDRMAIVAHDGRNLEMLSSWSSLQRPLARALDEAMRLPTKGLQRRAERQRYNFLGFDELFDSGDGEAADLAGAFGANLSPEERVYIGVVTEQLNRSVAAASATLRSFAKPPGRKVMILLAGGWPFVPADFLVSDTSRILFDRGGPFGSNLYRRLVETANVLGYTIYPVDLPGLDRDVIDVTRPENSDPPAPRTVENSGFRREDEVHETLRYLARETGGKALINARRLGALEQVSRDVGSYYWLGFSPQRARDDVSHNVDVRLRNPDFRTRSRGSFLDSSTDREVSMAVESTLLFGNAAASGSVKVEVGAPVDVSRRRMEVSIKVTIPLDEVTILPVGDRFGTQLQLRVAVQDDGGQQAPIPVIPLDVVMTSMPPPGAVGHYETKLLLRRKLHHAVVAIHDPASGRILSTGFEIDPGDR